MSEELKLYAAQSIYLKTPTMEKPVKYTARHRELSMAQVWQVIRLYHHNFIHLNGCPAKEITRSPVELFITGKQLDSLLEEML